MDASGYADRPSKLKHLGAEHHAKLLRQLSQHDARSNSLGSRQNQRARGCHSHSRWPATHTHAAQREHILCSRCVAQLPHPRGLRCPSELPPGGLAFRERDPFGVGRAPQPIASGFNKSSWACGNECCWPAHGHLRANQSQTSSGDDLSQRRGILRRRAKRPSGPALHYAGSLWQAPNHPSPKRFHGVVLGSGRSHLAASRSLERHLSSQG